MAVNAINSTAGLTQTQLDALNSANHAQGRQTLGQADFLKLLTVQLQSQDPMSPMQDTEFISQMASFTSLQQMQTLTSSFEEFSKTQQLSAAQSYLGKTVTVVDANSDTGEVTGTVSSIAVSDGAPRLTINGTQYDLSALESVSATAAAALPATPTPN